MLHLRGSPLARSRADGEPRPEAGAPRKPDDLPAAGAALWDELVPQLDACGLLTLVDGGALARYCRLHAVWKELDRFLAESGHGHPIKDSRGNVVGVRLYPQLRALLNVSEHMLRLEQQYGLTPAARASLGTPFGAQEDRDDSAVPFTRSTG
jgi:P27 family predicted phage terminase small subunit